MRFSQYIPTNFLSTSQQIYENRDLDLSISSNLSEREGKKERKRRTERERENGRSVCVFRGSSIVRNIETGERNRTAKHTTKTNPPQPWQKKEAQKQPKNEQLNLTPLHKIPTKPCPSFRKIIRKAIRNS